MNKVQKILSIFSVLALVLVSIFMFTACGETEKLPLEQGSHVFTIGVGDVDGVVVDKYSNYDEYKASEYGEMKLGASHTKSKDLYFNKEFFTKHKLITAKTNIDGNANLVLKSIKVDGDKYTADMVEISKGGTATNKVVALVVIEVDKDVDISNATLSLDIVKVDRESGLPKVADLDGISKFYCSSIRESDAPLEVFKLDNIDEVNYYKARSNEVTKQVLTTLKDDFFNDNYVLGVDYIKKNIDTITTMRMDGDTLYVDNYTSTHYSYNALTNERTVRFIAVPRTCDINKVILAEHMSSNVGESIESVITSVDVAK